MNHSRHLTQSLTLALLLLSGCAHQTPGSRVDISSGVDAQELVTRFGFPKCTVSAPLSEEEAAKSAELVGAPNINQRKDWVALTGLMIPGDELRHVWCNPHRGRGGVDLIGVFRAKHLIAELHTVFVD
jgi:hypothetical protein